MPQTVIGCDPARGRIGTHALPPWATAKIENTGEAVLLWTASLPCGALIVFEGDAEVGSVPATDPPPTS